jgi:hypothetical protein
LVSPDRAVGEGSMIQSPLRVVDDGGPKIYRFRHASGETVTAAGHRLEEDIDPVAKISCRFRVWPRRW